MKNNQPVTQREVDYDESEVFISRTDLKGIITSVNETFCRIAGYAEDELVGVNHNIVRHPDMPEWAFQSLWDTLKAARPWRGIVKNRCKNGDHYWVRATVTPILRDGQAVGYLSLRKKPSRQQVAAAGPHQCRLGKWLEAESRTRYGDHPAFQAIEALHRRGHALAIGLLDLQARGRKRESLAGLGELNGLRDALLERLQTLSASAENLKPGQFELTTC